MMEIAREARDLHRRIEVTDIHVHPSLKTYLFNHRIATRHLSGKFWMPLFMRVDFPKVVDGDLRVLVASTYLPERALLNDCKPLKILRWFSGKRIRSLFEGDAFKETMKILDHFENEVNQARVGREPVAEVARSWGELKRIRQRGLTAVLHSIEGAHSLAGDAANVQRFFDRGVCMLTLAHFYKNEMVAPVRGIPESMAHFGCFEKADGSDEGLTDLGYETIDEMKRLGMIIDLSHCSPLAREQIVSRVGTDRPLIFSHVGVQPVANYPMSPTCEEMHHVADSGGVIGIIFMNYWLGDPEAKNGLDLIVRNIRAVVDEVGEDYVAIGSDFDGFTDPPDDVKDTAQLPRLTQALLCAKFSEIQIEKFWGTNFHRVLKSGWGRE